MQEIRSLFLHCELFRLYALSPSVQDVNRPKITETNSIAFVIVLFSLIICGCKATNIYTEKRMFLVLFIASPRACQRPV